MKTKSQPLVEVPCASVLKPIYSWFAPRSRDWESLAHASITRSDNDATNEIVDRCGGVQRLAALMSALTGRDVMNAATWGRFLVDEALVKRMYEAMVGADSAALVVEMMREVVPAQRFGVEPGVAMKAGWDLQRMSEGRLHLITNLVALRDFGVEVKLGAVPVPSDSVMKWNALLASRGPEGVIEMHHENAPHLKRSWWRG